MGRKGGREASQERAPQERSDVSKTGIDSAPQAATPSLPAGRDDPKASDSRPAAASDLNPAEPYAYRVKVRTSLKRATFKMQDFKDEINPQKSDGDDINANLIGDLVSSRDSKNISCIKSEATQQPEEPLGQQKPAIMKAEHYVINKKKRV